MKQLPCDPLSSEHNDIIVSLATCVLFACQTLDNILLELPLVQYRHKKGL